MTDNPTLYIVATPIGNLQDISARALSVLRMVDVIAAEDTRHARNLLHHYAITSALVSYHQHNEQARTLELIKRLESGQSVALISDAGTPLISDPGYPLVASTLKAGIKVVPIPGASALLTALCSAGLPTDNFQFVGFLPSTSSRRQRQLGRLYNFSGSLVFYESPHRIIESLGDMVVCLGGQRKATVCRELTKKFESICHNNLAGLLELFETKAEPSRGEFVIVVEGCEQIDAPQAEWVDATIELYQFMPLKRAAKFVAGLTGSRSQNLYAEASSKINQIDTEKA